MIAANPAEVGDLVAFESKRKYQDAPSPWFVGRVTGVDEDGYVTEVEGKYGPTPLKQLCRHWYLIPTPLLKEGAPLDEALHNAWTSRDAILALLKPFCVDDYEARRDLFYSGRQSALRQARSDKEASE